MTTILREEWRAASPHYEVSSFGEVRRLAHVRIGPTGRRTTLRAMTMKGGLDKDGYRQVRIEGRLISVHALVARAFIGPKPAGTEVCHNDGNKLNCRRDNLRYDTHSQNVKDAVAHGTWRGNTKLTAEQVRDVRSRLYDGESNASIARLYSVDPSLISNIKRGHTWSRP